MDVRFHPLPTWPERSTPAEERKSGTFKAGWNDTLDLLDRELRHLDARDIVIQAGLQPADIRVDGWPRANARQPVHPGVIVSFASKHGPLRYATDVFEVWHHNVRAIALGLEALRKVDRYGISQRGEQYTGWKALGAGRPAVAGEKMTVEDAARLLGDIAFAAGSAESLKLIGNGELIADAYRRAVFRTHPDRPGGDAETFRRVNEARDLLIGVVS